VHRFVRKVVLVCRIWYSRFSSPAWTSAAVGCLAAFGVCRLGSSTTCTGRLHVHLSVRVTLADCPTCGSTQDSSPCRVRCGGPDPSRTEHSPPCPRRFLPRWSSAVFCGDQGVERWGKSKMCEGIHGRATPRARRVRGVEHVLTPLRVSLFSLVRGLVVTPAAWVFRGAKDSLARRDIRIGRLTVRLEPRSTDRQTVHQPQWTDARPLWTATPVRGTVVRCLN
jgi:hypothetical protein